MKILYGTVQKYVDVTSTINQTLDVIIPSGDVNRNRLFGIPDPLPGILKEVVINDIVYIHVVELKVNVKHNTVEVLTSHDLLEATTKLHQIHQTLQLSYGNFSEEYPEQIMAVTYIKPDNCVLEIGGNVGRNSLVIAKLLNDQTNLVTLESDSFIASQLTHNRDNNKLTFNIENSALSSRKLIQLGWDTIPSDILLPGYKSVSNISFEELEKKYNKRFDTLVADCEGALYYILQDFTTMLTNINIIIMENDYKDINQKNKVDEIIKLNGFERIYYESGGWGPCYHFFFEVWKKTTK